MLCSIMDRKLKKLELFKVPVLLVITCKSQILARNILGTQGRILIRLFYLFVLSGFVTYVKTEKNMFTPSGLNS